MKDVAPRQPRHPHRQGHDVDQAARAAMLRQQPAVVWLTGLSGASKSSLANVVASRLHTLGHATYVLDGDNSRQGLNSDLGFADTDRIEEMRRVAELALLMMDAGLIVITAFISSFRRERALARSRAAAGDFIDVHVDLPLAVAEARDAKGQ
jgi:bifunctional enzyme CysN/CysC